jgi:hypothetical protein
VLAEAACEVPWRPLCRVEGSYARPDLPQIYRCARMVLTPPIERALRTCRPWLIDQVTVARNTAPGGCLEHPISSGHQPLPERREVRPFPVACDIEAVWMVMDALR